MSLLVRSVNPARAVLLVMALTLVGCQSAPRVPLPLAHEVDLERFSGDWYVIGGILTRFEDDAFNAVESYRVETDGTVTTRFAFNRGAFDGKRVEYSPRAFVRPDSGNAIWGMQFIWPFRADYRIVRLADDYSLTVIGRVARDYVWVMAREPELDPERWNEVLSWLEEIGYPREEIRRVPHAPRQGPADDGLHPAMDN